MIVNVRLGCAGCRGFCALAAEFRGAPPGPCLVTLASQVADPEREEAAAGGAADRESPDAGAEWGGGAAEPAEGDPILGAALQTLKQAAEGVEVEREVAETLQRSLLPRLPVVPGLRLAARYRPGSVETRIGGDWYDAIPLRGGKVGIAIGDVVGRGVKAAARMAHLQSALRAYALEALRPELVLERMNGFVLEGEQGGMVTLLYAIVDPDGHTVQVASAGHPPPMVLDPEGRSTFVEAPAGSPLGVARYAAYEESVTALDPWSALLLYTDGLVEGPTLPLGQGLEGLLGSMEGGPREPEALCQAVLDSLDVRVGFSDDLALLALQLTPPGETLGLEFPARPSSLASMRRAVAQWLRLAGATEDEIYEILVACGEACANAVAHAHPALTDSSFEVVAEVEDGEIEIAVRDTGRWRPPGDNARGRGLSVMRELMDEVEVEPSERGTTVTLRRRLRGEGSA
jgi:serine phosphatase RsbU (regulator of sigma subunit)/anti-sigma regulatory factor (Ser/Thr protein kinase)